MQFLPTSVPHLAELRPKRFHLMQREVQFPLTWRGFLLLTSTFLPFPQLPPSLRRRQFLRIALSHPMNPECRQFLLIELSLPLTTKLRGQFLQIVLLLLKERRCPLPTMHRPRLSHLTGQQLLRECLVIHLRCRSRRRFLPLRVQRLKRRQFLRIALSHLMSPECRQFLQIVLLLLKECLAFLRQCQLRRLCVLQVQSMKSKVITEWYTSRKFKTFSLLTTILSNDTLLVKCCSSVWSLLLSSLWLLLLLSWSTTPAENVKSQSTTFHPSMHRILLNSFKSVFPFLWTTFL
jgi:hypothetical protein